MVRRLSADNTAKEKVYLIQPQGQGVKGPKKTNNGVSFQVWTRPDFCRGELNEPFPKSEGLSLEKIERVSFREEYCSSAASQEATQCVICLSGSLRKYFKKNISLKIFQSSRRA